jgi:hypothetical protein
VDSLNQLQAYWDKFELMMESHQLMVKEQVYKDLQNYINKRCFHGFNLVFMSSVL